MGDVDLDPVYVIYDELEATLNYSCESGQGEVSKTTETITAVTGSPTPVTATAKEGFKFKKWEVKRPDGTWAKVSESPELTPPRNANNIYVSANYRAIFETDSVEVYFVSNDTSLGTLEITPAGQLQSVPYASEYKVELDAYGNIVLNIYAPSTNADPIVSAKPVATTNNVFDKWNVDESGTLTESFTLFVASFKIPTADVTFASRNNAKGTVNSDAVKDIPKGSTYSVASNGTLTVTNGRTGSETSVTVRSADNYLFDY